jgi:hypothetical protein
MRGAQARLRAVRRGVAIAKPPKRDAGRALGTRRLLAGLRGARLCYGDPVEVDGRTVIPVARVRAAGGRGERGAGGRVDAVPVGFIEVSASGARFEPFAQPGRPARALAAGGAALAVAGAAALRRRPRALRGAPRRRSLPR